jgi:Flp pilus assembly protein protease CpaA
MWLAFSFAAVVFFVLILSLRHDEQPAPAMAPIAARRMSPSQALAARRGFGLTQMMRAGL